MKLKLIKRQVLKENKDPRITISYKGTFYLSPAAMDLLNAKKEKIKVLFFQDESDSQSWFIKPSKDGYVTVAAKESSGRMHIRDIARQIISSFHHISEKPLAFNLTEPIALDNEFY